MVRITTFVSGILLTLLWSPYALAANTRLARSKLDFHKGDIRKANARLWRLLKSDTLSKQRQLSNKERAEVRRLLGSSTYLLTGNAAKSRLAYRKSLEFARKRPLFSFEKRDEKVADLYAAATRGRAARYIARPPKPVSVRFAIRDLATDKPIEKAFVSVKDTLSPFAWTGQSIPLEPGKHRLRIEAPGYKPTQVLWNVNHKKEGRFINVKLVPLNIFNKPLTSS